MGVAPSTATVSAGSGCTGSVMRSVAVAVGPVRPSVSVAMAVTVTSVSRLTVGTGNVALSDGAVPITGVSDSIW